MFEEALNARYGKYQDFIRRKMVEDQIVRRGVSDPRVLAAMEKVKRHLFVDEYLRTRAYEDQPLPLAMGQTISQPYIVALMTELLALKGGERVLEIGTGSGYQTAVLAELAAEVFTVEFFPELAGRAASALSAAGYRNISFMTGDGSEGWAGKAPFGAILAGCAAPERPEKLLAQLADGGRLAAPVGAGETQRLMLYEKRGNTVTEKAAAEVRFVPMLRRQ